jgi:hypothetical protein
MMSAVMANPPTNRGDESARRSQENQPAPAVVNCAFEKFHVTMARLARGKWAPLPQGLASGDSPILKGYVPVLTSLTMGGVKRVSKVNITRLTRINPR